MNPAPVCYACQSFECEWIESRGEGEVYTFTIVHHPVNAATEAVVPYNAAVIRLDDCGSVKLTSNIVECRNEDISIGMPVQIVWEDTTQEISLYRFRPALGGRPARGDEPKERER